MNNKNINLVCSKCWTFRYSITSFQKMYCTLFISRVPRSVLIEIMSCFYTLLVFRNILMAPLDNFWQKRDTWWLWRHDGLQQILVNSSHVTSSTIERTFQKHYLCGKFFWLSFILLFWWHLPSKFNFLNMCCWYFW